MSGHYRTFCRNFATVVQPLTNLNNCYGLPLVDYTNHNPITFLSCMYNHTQRLMRWALLIQDCNLVIKHKKGTENVIADALSRVDCCCCSCSETMVLNLGGEVLHIPESGVIFEYVFFFFLLFFFPPHHLSPAGWKRVPPDVTGLPSVVLRFHCIPLLQLCDIMITWARLQSTPNYKRTVSASLRVVCV